MKAMFAVFKRELREYFTTPLAYVFIIIFLALSMAFTFYLGNFYTNRQANLTSFFAFHPWLYLFLVPALSMRLWSEELKTGSIELLMTLPITTMQAVLGKFLAAWLFIAVALGLTFPIWITVNYLGNPDNGIVLSAYIGSWLMAGGFLAIGSCISATTKNQVIAFIISIVVCFMFLLSSFPIVLDAFRWLPQLLVDTIVSLSFIAHFNSISKGILAVQDIVFFALLIAFWLIANVAALEMKKAN